MNKTNEKPCDAGVPADMSMGRPVNVPIKCVHCGAQMTIAAGSHGSRPCIRCGKDVEPELVYVCHDPT